ncbi:hypothetical protein O181_037208 [Austropuccinia psidii MF-1]|uniref:Uncharacterized protein n=1 Tax=Austropuccinia psidii MF-1 TaxID=1389203 RepID=A0A9Q3D8X9_9BASI|nr:hypothetical protein [Austropuccinia psidii MF-1]
MGFKCQKQNPPNLLQQDTCLPHIPRKQTVLQPTPGPIGTQWLEDLFCKPSQHNEPPIPGPSQSSKSQVPLHEDALTCEPEPEVSPTQSTKEPFGKSPLYFFYSYQLWLTPPFTISSSSHYSPLCHYHQEYALRLPLPQRSQPPPPLGNKLPPFPQWGLEGIYPLATNPNSSLSNHPRLNQQNLVGALPIAPHDSLHGCD